MVTFENWKSPCAFILKLLLTVFSVSSAWAQERGKLADDPTNIVTKLGVSYNDDFAISGSLAFGPFTKLNARVSETGEWSFGGSYLFGFGIINISAARSALSNGFEQTRYSLGSFAPILRKEGDPRAWQVFATFGFNYTEGEAGDIEFSAEYVGSFSMTSKGGYIGAMALKPLSDQWTFRGMTILSKGSDYYSGYALGGGFSYYLTDRDTLSVMAFYSDNSFGENDSFGFGYQREF